MRGRIRDGREKEARARGITRMDMEGKRSEGRGERRRDRGEGKGRGEVTEETQLEKKKTGKY